MHLDVGKYSASQTVPDAIRRGSGGSHNEDDRPSEFTAQPDMILIRMNKSEFRHFFTKRAPTRLHDFKFLCAIRCRKFPMLGYIRLEEKTGSVSVAPEEPKVLRHLESKRSSLFRRQASWLSIYAGWHTDPADPLPVANCAIINLKMLASYSPSWSEDVQSWVSLHGNGME